MLIFVLLLFITLKTGEGTYCMLGDLGDRTCNNCANDAFSNPYCQTCYSGYLAFRSRCLACKWPCSTCTIDVSINTALWTGTVETFWNTKFTDALTTQTAPNPLPSFMNNFDFSTMSASQKQGWT